ncbi:expressed protein, partial [Dictyostelium purpureum]
MSDNCLLETVKKGKLPPIKEFFSFDTSENPKQKFVRKSTDPSEHCYSRKKLATSNSNGGPSYILDNSRSLNTQTDDVFDNMYPNYNNDHLVQPHFHMNSQQIPLNVTQTIQNHSNFHDMNTLQTQSNISQTVQTQSNFLDMNTEQIQPNVSQTIQTQSNFHDMNTQQIPLNVTQTVQNHSNLHDMNTLQIHDMNTLQTQSNVSQTEYQLTPEDWERPTAIKMQQTHQ